MQYFQLITLVALTTLSGLVSGSSINSPMAKRDLGKLYCCPVAGQDFTPQDISDIETNINDLSKTTKHFKTTAGKCYTVSDYNNVAIVLCNDAYDSTVNPTQIADYAQYIVNHCPHTTDNKVCGQLFNTGNWDVIIDADSGLPYPPS